MIGDMMGIKLVEKEEEYYKYIGEHIDNVNQAFSILVYNVPDWDLANCLGISLVEVGRLLREMSIQISEHDISKYSDEEFSAYRANFFPIDDKEKENNKEAFNKAWEHHYKNNPHHWNYWLNDDGVPSNMTIKYIIEMICDWQGMGFKFGNNCKEWYDKNKENIILANKTRNIVERLLDLYVQYL